MSTSVWALYLHYHREDDIPVTYQYICRSKKDTENIITELRKPHYKHAEEVIKLYEKNEMGYLRDTINFVSTLDFLEGGDMLECETDEEIINEIICHEFFSYEIKEKIFNFNGRILMSDKCSLY